MDDKDLRKIHEVFCDAMIVPLKARRDVCEHILNMRSTPTVKGVMLLWKIKMLDAEITALEIDIERSS